jgi:putative transposase
MAVEKGVCNALTIVDWVDIFTRKVYKEVIVDALKYSIQEKNLELYAWVIMSNHIHLVACVNSPNQLSDFLRDFKKFTSKQIIEEIKEGNESRKDWLLDHFSFEAKRSRRARYYKLWRDGNHAMDLKNFDIDILQKIDYIHENPVRAGLVEYPEHYIHSSATDYNGKNGLLPVTVI